MSTALLAVHSVVRWFVLGSLIVAVILAATALAQKRAYEPLHNRASLFAVNAIDFQVLLGLIMYFFVSDVTATARASFGAAMKDHYLRFWAVEHPIAMLLAVVLVHVGRATSKRGADPAKKHKRTLVYFAIALALVCAGLPWPFIAAYGRPLLPSFG